VVSLPFGGAAWLAVRLSRRFRHSCLMEHTNKSAGEVITVAKLYHFDTDRDRSTSASGNGTPCARTTVTTAWDSDERAGRNFLWCDTKKLP
jgi:hypothetical protein